MQILKRIYIPNTIKMASLRTCLQTNHEMSFSEANREPIIGQSSLRRIDTKLSQIKFTQQF